MRDVFKVMRAMAVIVGMGWLYGCVLRVNDVEWKGKVFADSLPVIDAVDTVNPVVCIIDSVGGMFRFHYESGRMVGGDCGHYGHFTVGFCPLSIDVKRCSDDRKDCLSYDARYDNICLDDSGHILSMDATAVNFSSDSLFVDNAVWHIRYEMSYKNGYIRELSYILREGNGKNEHGKVVYTWDKGDLVTMVLDYYSRYEVYEEHVSQTFLYGDNDSVSVVAGAFSGDPASPPYIHEFIWYTGLLGKGMQKLPECVLIERCGDCGNSQVKLQIDSEDSVMARKLIYMDGSIAGYTYGMCP